MQQSEAQANTAYNPIYFTYPLFNLIMQLRIPADNRRVAKPPLALTSRSRYFG